MTPQQFTPHHQRLRTYLLETVKLPAEKFRFGDTHASACGKVDTIETMQVASAIFNVAPDLIALPPDTQLRFTNEFSIHLIIKEFDGELSFFIGQLLFWLASEFQDIAFEYKVYWSNEVSMNIECFLEIEERAKGSQITGFNVH